MAAITKRGPYHWRAQVRRQGYPAQSKTFNTKAEAEAWANVIESEMARGILISRREAEAITLHEALVRYEGEISPSKKGATQDLSVIKACKAVDLTKRPLASIRSADLAKLRDDWLKTYKPVTVLRRLAVLSHVFSIARKEWGMESQSNPVELVRKPQSDNARTRQRVVCGEMLTAAPFEDDPESDRGARDGELERLIAATESKLLPSIVLLAIETAMRRGEIVSLQSNHVDLNRRVAHLPATQNGDARDVPLSSKAMTILEDLRKLNFPTMGSQAVGHSSNRVFKIRGDAVTRAFERAVTRAQNGMLTNARKPPCGPILTF